MKAVPKHSLSVRASSLKSKVKKPSLSLPPTSMTKAKTLAPTTIVPQPTPSSSGEDNRETILKKKFAGTISKAQRQLSENRKKVRSEKGREADGKGLEAVDDRRVVRPLAPSLEENEIRMLKDRREEMRAAARRDLEEVERRVVVDDSHASLREYERLCGFPIPYVGGFLNRMHYYGLYLKD